MNLRDSSRRPGTSSLNRRSFLAMLGSAGATRLIPGVARSDADDYPALLLVGACNGSDGGSIQTLAVQGGRCVPGSSALTDHPLALAVHPARPIVYVANGVSRYRHEPRGTIEAFAVDQRSGNLERLAVQPLSLAATEPRSLAVSPDGGSLLVAAFAGGAYNVMPLDAAGIPGPPSTILKQVGWGPHLPEQAHAHPVSVICDSRRPLGVAADFGADRIDLLAPDPESPHKFAVVSRISCPAGSGPSALALHRDGHLLIAGQRLRPALAVIRVGHPSRPQMLGEVSLQAAPAAIAWHPRRNVLYAVVSDSRHCSVVQSFEVDPGAGTLHQMDETITPAPDVRAIHAESSTLYLACARGVMVAAFDPVTGVPLSVQRIASIPGAVSLTAIPCAGTAV